MGLVSSFSLNFDFDTSVIQISFLLRLNCFVFLFSAIVYYIISGFFGMLHSYMCQIR